MISKLFLDEFIPKVKKYFEIIPVRISADLVSGRRKKGICTCIRLLLECSMKRKVRVFCPFLVGSCRWPSDGSFPHERIANQAANQPVYHRMMVSNGKSSCHSVPFDWIRNPFSKDWNNWFKFLAFSTWKHLKAFHSFEMCGMLFNGSLEGAPNLEVTWENSRLTTGQIDWISSWNFLWAEISDGISLKLKGFWTFSLDLVAFLKLKTSNLNSNLFTWAKVWATDRPNRWTSTAPVTEPPACGSRDREQVKTNDLKTFRDRWRPYWVRGGGARAASSGNRRPSVAGRCCWAEAAEGAAEGGAAADCDSADDRAAPHRLFPLVARIILFF